MSTLSTVPALWLHPYWLGLHLTLYHYECLYLIFLFFAISSPSCSCTTFPMSFSCSFIFFSAFLCLSIALVSCSQNSGSPLACIPTTSSLFLSDSGSPLSTVYLCSWLLSGFRSVSSFHLVVGCKVLISSIGFPWRLFRFGPCVLPLWEKSKKPVCTDPFLHRLGPLLLQVVGWQWLSLLEVAVHIILIVSSWPIICASTALLCPSTSSFPVVFSLKSLIHLLTPLWIFGSSFTSLS